MPTRTLSIADMVPNSRMFWNVRPMPMRGHLVRLARPDLVALLVDDRLAVEPDLAAGRERSTPVIMLKNVVLPAPFGPISDTIEPRGMSKSTALTAVSPPNRLVTRAGLDQQVVLGDRAGLAGEMRARRSFVPGL